MDESIEDINYYRSYLLDLGPRKTLMKNLIITGVSLESIEDLNYYKGYIGTR